MPSQYSEYFRVEQRGDITILVPTFSDYMNLVANIETKRDMIDFVRQEKPKKLVVNFEHIELFSTEFIGTLLSVKRLLGAEGRIKLCCLTQIHHEVFQLLNLEGTVFEIHESLEDASNAC